MTTTTAAPPEPLGILLVDDQPSKLLSYEVVLEGLGQRMFKAESGNDALELLLRHDDIAVMLVDVSMPGLNGFKLAEVVRAHPRFEKLAIIFVSAIHLSEHDVLRGYSLGAVDYVSVPFVPALLVAKVATFLELHRKTRALEKLNAELEERVRTRTEALQAASRRQALLAREVDHRARNALALVQAIVRITQAPDVASFQEAVHGRIRALGLAHQLLSRTRWEGADLHRIAQDELAPYCGPERMTISGPSVTVGPAAAQMLALAVHELATNAVKHGALSNEEGRIAIEWSLDDRELRLEWKETGGPPVCPPAERGFGTMVIDMSFSAQLGGRVDLEWPREGLVCTAVLPRGVLAASVASGGEPAAARGQETAAPRTAPAGKRVLVVEDEALVALDLSRMIKGMGLEVVGPAHNVDRALELSLDEEVDIALLDVNVGGKEVYPVSDALGALDVPIVYLTGYEREVVRGVRTAAAVLQKPVQPALLRDTLAKVLDDRRALKG